ncbi:hypothetical protein B296_00032177 [Ensete ventricosum]|uniref:3'-N-debenzoyl-2'-deoxytaxol N-benzoyltransferase n=1 Tax=Ensete ventricosum TaxID=4639 RepID=A0A426ZXX4_ENSVE|nr:hypothetical protein B296_00032177 [Ensete ventricosum]
MEDEAAGKEQYQHQHQETTLDTMGFAVTMLAEGLVAPCEHTPSATLTLSSVDHALGLRFSLEMISAYGHGVEAASLIRGALSRALVPYYPVAGRLVTSAEGELEVACTGDGVWFVEKMVHLGVKFSHMVFDGVGAGQFLKTVGEIAGGLSRPTVEPIWFRDAIPAPPRLPRQPPMITFDCVPSLFDFPQLTINNIKEELMRETAYRCTTFEAVAAVLWRCRTRAINLPPHADAHLVFSANVRPLLCQLLPPQRGYYGNCVYCLNVTSSSDKIKHAPLTEIVSLIRDAKASLAAKFSEWAMGNVEEDPYNVPNGYDVLNLSDWRSVGFFGVDYGWGTPHCVVPLNDHLFFAGGILLKRPLPEQGLRFMGEVVTEEHQESFVNELKWFAESCRHKH